VENDDIYDLISDLRHWLEWQQDCGAQDWTVEDWSEWTKVIKRQAAPQRTPKRASKPVQSQGRGKKDVAQAPPKNTQPPRELSNEWSSILNNARPTLDVERLAKGTDGFNSVRQYRNQNCNASTKCQLGLGNIQAPVLIIEGHSQPMTKAGFEMLAKMREHVLNLKKEQIFFLSHPTRFQGCACKSIFNGQLNVLSPKFILIMGSECVDDLFPVSKRPIMGNEGVLTIRGEEIPTLWTHHPNHLIQNGHEKRTVMRHLQNVRRTLLRRNIIS
jgi:hypothetical protein